MIRMTVRLKSVSCSDTEDLTGADTFYTVSAFTTGDVNETQAAISSPRSINHGESKLLDHIVFDGIIDDGATVRGGIVAFDEDAAKEWEKKPEWVETVRDKVVSGLKESEVPELTAAGAVLDWAYKGIEFLMQLDKDDKLGSTTIEMSAGGPSRQTFKWNFSKEDWTGYSDWQYSAEFEVVRVNVPRMSSVWRPGQTAEIQLYGVPFEAFKDRYDELWPQEWRLHLLQVYNDPAGIRYDAVWRPGTTGERQIYGVSFADFKKAYDELWPQGWRLELLQVVPREKGNRYYAIWRPGQAAELHLWGVPFEAFKKRYDELWPQNWRLHALQVYRDAAGIRYDAVWRPGTTSERQVYGVSHADFKKTYDDLWPKGWRLEMLQVLAHPEGTRHYAVWRPGQTAEMQLYGVTYEAFKQRYDELWPQGWRLHILERE